MNALQLVSFLGIGRRRVREILSWADENPGEAAALLWTLAGWLRHRATILGGRRWAFRRAHRIRRNQSGADQLEKLAALLRQGDATGCRAELGEPAK